MLIREGQSNSFYEFLRILETIKLPKISGVTYKVEYSYGNYQIYKFSEN